VLNTAVMVSPSAECRWYWMRHEVTGREALVAGDDWSTRRGSEAVMLTVVCVSFRTDTLRGMSGTAAPH